MHTRRFVTKYLIETIFTRIFTLVLWFSDCERTNESLEILQPQTFIWHTSFEWHLHEHATLDLFFSTKKKPFQAYLNVSRAWNENDSDIVKKHFLLLFEMKESTTLYSFAPKSFLKIGIEQEWKVKPNTITKTPVKESHNSQVHCISTLALWRCQLAWKKWAFDLNKYTLFFSL